jgi:transcriptional regulator with XRE-family HTH domain
MVGIRKQKTEMKQIAKMLLANRLLAGHTQTDIAQKLFVTFQQYQKWENGVNRISADQLLSLCKEFNYNWNDFMKEPDEFCKTISNLRTKEKLIQLFTRISRNVDKASRIENT